jgi:5'(3')-deoxyribonucleotidase
LVLVASEGGAEVSEFTIGLDADGVLYDFVGAACKWSGFKRENATSFDIFRSWGAPNLWAAFDRHAQEKGFCSSLELLPGAQEFVYFLQRIAPVVIVTSPYRDAPYWAHEREKAIVRDFGIDREMVMSVRNKRYARVSLLIDDKTANIKAFPEKTIVFDQPWNQDCDVGMRCKRYSDVLESVREMSQC